jgi:pilus assembly protein TadC
VAVELVRMALGAGSTPRQALEILAATRLGPTRDLARRVLVASDAGLSLREACVLHASSSAAAAGLLDLLSDGQHSGAPLDRALAQLGDDIRGTLRRRAEERARAAPVKLLFPLVLLSLPAFVLLTIAPAVLRALSR